VNIISQARTIVHFIISTTGLYL